MRTNSDGWKSYEMAMLESETDAEIVDVDVYKIPEADRPEQLFLDLFFLDEEDPDTEQIWSVSLTTGHPNDNWIPCAELALDDNRQYHLVSKNADIPYAYVEVVSGESDAVKSLILRTRLI